MPGPVVRTETRIVQYDKDGNVISDVQTVVVVARPEPAAAERPGFYL